MSKIKLYYDKEGETLSIWLDDPKKEAVSEELGDGIIVSKDKKGRVIGFEKLYVEFPHEKGVTAFPFELGVS